MPTGSLEGFMHGIERTRKLQNELPQSTRVVRIVFRYTDGRTLTFIPEAGREAFIEDDMIELDKVLEQASSTVEWAEIGRMSGPGG
jgi:hypothetical protein